MGADPTRPDVFLQVEWMADAEHDQRPDPRALQLVVEAFARSPFTGPSGSEGIALHVDAGPDSVLGPGRTWDDLSRARPLPWQDNLGTAASGTYDWTEYLALRDRPGGFTETGRAPIFHYAIFGHFHDRDSPSGVGASGISRGIGGTELLVTLGNFTNGVGNVQEQAGTLMHELGHNLGLRHGGCDDSNFKPGYASVMNYAFQMDGLVRGGVRGVVDYSRGAPPVLDEVLASEPLSLLAVASPLPGGSCIAPAKARSGMAVRPTLGPGTDAATETSPCAAGGDVDDWRSLRLNVGAIGREERAARSSRRSRPRRLAR
jgi:hypothetical protein